MRAGGRQSGVRRRLLGSLREFGPTAVDVPGHELAKHGRAVPLAGSSAELFPQLILDPDRSVRRVGVLHGAIVARGYADGWLDGLPCISTVSMVAAGSVYIHAANDSTAHTEVSGTLAIVDRTLPAHEKCGTHRLYFLACSEYEEMLARCGQRCEICSMAGVDTPTGKLFIDHDGQFGNWAVRGLLCHLCNNRLGQSNEFRPEATAYLANARFVRILAARGLKPEHPPEPPIGSRVRDGGCVTWTHERDGYWRPNGGGLHRRWWRQVIADRAPYFDLELLHYGDPEVTMSLRVEDPRSVADELRKYMSAETRQTLARLLLEE